MNVYKYCFFGWLRCQMVMFSIAIASCGVQNKTVASNNITRDDQSFYWRIAIKIQTNNSDTYKVLSVLSGSPQLVSLNLSNDLPVKSQPGTIVIYITATTGQVEQLKPSLFDAGAMGVFTNTINHY